jgi:hypothetical protein
MERASLTPEVSVTPSVSDLGNWFKTLEVEQTPEVSTHRDTTTNKCERKQCQQLVSRTAVMKVTAREPNGTTKAMLVCPQCFNHYQAKSSTSISRKWPVSLFWM